jgi:alpha-L-rhamnosidase
MRFLLVQSLFVTLAFWLPAAGTVAAEPAAFRAATPVWPKGRETEMNLLVGFRAVIDAPPGGGKEVELHVAASTIYRAWLNGRFLGCGPARGPHGHYRVDVWKLSLKPRPGGNVVAIEVAGYNANGYYLLDQPSFCQAEVAAGDRVLASTAGEGRPFDARILDFRVQKVQRYSFQRPFIEVYRLAPGWDTWRLDPQAPPGTAELAVQPAKALLARGVPYPESDLKRPVGLVGAGKVERRAKVESLWKDRSLVDVGPKLKGYAEKDLAVVISTEMQYLKSTTAARVAARAQKQPVPPGTKIPLGAGEYRILDLGANLTGLLGCRVSCAKKARLVMVFDEILSDGDVDFKRLGCVNVVTYDLEPGTYELESIEPYTLRYLKLIALEGPCDVSGVVLREYAHAQPRHARFAAGDPRLEKLFAAGLLTFRQNATDIFMDCPSRERAGWLCDSFFTARVAADVAGNAAIEHNFFQNFLLPDRFAHLPDGMLPMCYPADHNDGVYIPNWAMWFVVQLEEYLARSGDRATVDALRPKVLKLLEFLKKYENADGLLEKLPSWVFVEWSKANEFVQDVNYPSNMLYAGTLSAAGRMYGLPELAAKALKVRQTVRQQSFDGQFFVDNAVRKGGKLEVTRNRTEVCQYFAFFFGVADRRQDAKLWAVLCDQFGPDRAQKKLWPEVHPANSFIGNMLRMELLSEAGRGQQILDESIAYLIYMAERTGTLWENVGAYASCNHGFASHVVHTLYRDVLGLRRVDVVGRRVEVRFQDLRLPWCEGAIPTPHGPVELRWRHQDDRLHYRLVVPAGYQAAVENRSRMTAVEEK